MIYGIFHTMLFCKEIKVKRLLVFTGLSLVLLLEFLSAEEKLYIFFPSTVRPQAIQDKMQQISQGTTITVFGRYTDFTAKIEMEPPDAILTKTSLVKQMNDYSVSLNGIRGGKTVETYVLLSVDTPVDLSTITSETVIGTIDFLGRTGMNDFVKKYLPVVPKIKRVTKIEDLLPLLSFNMASAILIEEHCVDYFKKTSNLNFVVTPLSSNDDGIIALAAKKDASIDKTTELVKKLGSDAKVFFSVDQIK